MMAVASKPSQTQFYREFLMGRGNYDPKEFGVDMTRQDLADLMVGDFAEVYRDSWTIDELLLHPREAAHFCDDVKRKHGFYDLPDDVILRSILNRRKNP